MTRTRPLLGTWVEVTAAGLPRAKADAAIDRAFGAVMRVHALMSPREPASDVVRLNSAPVGQWVRVHRWTWQVLAAARRLSEQSDGVFDVTAGSGDGDWHDVELCGGRRIRRRWRVSTDLGGIAKGFAVDRAIEALKRSGVPRGSVNAGGDLRVFGPLAESVAVRHPRSSAVLVPIAQITDGALATSANYLDAPGAGRLRAKRSHRLWIGRGSVSVCAPTCMMADALTKVVAAVGLRGAAGILRRHRATALAIKRSGEIVTGPDISPVGEKPEEVRHVA